jgi:cellulose synthase/poly-beta-1,6-N-acetylglucosamine synthase-like glycosyltransferase
MRVLVGMPCGENIHHLTALHFAGLITQTRESGIEAIPEMHSGSMAPNNRSALAKRALETHCDALLLVDCDMIFPPNALIDLLTHGDDKDVIGCAYSQRMPNGPVHGQEMSGAPIDCGAGGPPREVGTLPAGFILIRTRVLTALQNANDTPYFRFPYQAGDDVSFSEDFDFCRRVRAVGYKVWVDPNLSLALGHIGSAVYSIPRRSAVRECA